MTGWAATADLGSLGYGGAQIGNMRKEYTEAEVHGALAAAWDGGIRYFDTAPHYGLGLSEHRMGEFLGTKPRHEYVVSTKVGRLIVPAPAGAARDSDFEVPGNLRREWDPSESGIRRSLEDSLTRMGLDRVDILYLHDPDAYDLDGGLATGLPALAKLREEGLVRAVGVGVNDAAVAARAIREGDLDLVMIAGRYTLLEQPAREELVPTALEHGVRLVAAAPYNSGLLATESPSASGYYNYAAVPDKLVRRASELAEVCREFGTTLPVAALHYPLLDPSVAVVVAGAGTASSVTQNIERMNTQVPAALWQALRDRGYISA